jgi:hypothetical protein
MKTRINSYLIILLIITISFSACKDDEPIIIPPQLKQVQVNFKFSHLSGDEEIDFTDIKYVNEFGNIFSVETLKYFISDITFHRLDGSTIFFDEEFYMDAQPGVGHIVFPQTKVPEGDYTSISFIFGLNQKKNISGAYPNPPENNMEWPVTMGGGYHYMKLEGKFLDDGSTKNYQCHTGPTMGNQNFIRVNLPSSQITVSGEEMLVTIGMNVNKWWESPNVFDLNEMSGIMSNQDIQVQLKENGADVFSFLSIN